MPGNSCFALLDAGSNVAFDASLACCRPTTCFLLFFPFCPGSSSLFQGFHLFFPSCSVLSRAQSHGFLAVRLVEGGLIRLGRQAQRQGTSTGAAEPALEGAQAAGEPAQAPPLPPPPPPQQQQQLRDNVQAQGPDKGRAAAAAGNAAAAVAQEPQPAQGQPQEHPLRRHLEKLFPYPQGPSTPAPARLQVEAKRALAQLLADAPPPHQVHASALGAPLLQLLGGRRCPDGMRRLCATSPRVFEVVPQVGR